MRSSVDLCSISDTPAMTQTQANVFDINVAPNTAQGNSEARVFSKRLSSGWAAFLY